MKRIPRRRGYIDNQIYNDTGSVGMLRDKEGCQTARWRNSAKQWCVQLAPTMSRASVYKHQQKVTHSVTHSAWLGVMARATRPHRLTKGSAAEPGAQAAEPTRRPRWGAVPWEIGWNYGRWPRGCSYADRFLPNVSETSRWTQHGNSISIRFAKQKNESTHMCMCPAGFKRASANKTPPARRASGDRRRTAPRVPVRVPERRAGQCKQIARVNWQAVASQHPKSPLTGFSTNL